ncbi:hypothetical protein AbraIFM66950_006877 [Aspergillus brasiliensis]|nr:hypothetical protein AbraIFM66950_006877 [Aspergillus brasiliensis]
MAQGGIQLEELPLELLQAILATIPSIRSLEAAVMTGPCLYNAFKGAEQVIVRSVIRHQIDADLLHDVLAAHASSKIAITSNTDDSLDSLDLLYELRESFMVSYHARDQRYFSASMEWSLSQALLIDQLDEAVEYFVDRIATEALHIPSTSDSETPAPVTPPSRTERNRISRSLYRFHTYCNLHSGWSSKEVHSKFFAPWENEQLYCIFEYLLDVVKRGLIHARKVALHTERHLQQIVRVLRDTPDLEQSLNFLFSDEYRSGWTHYYTPRLKTFNAEDEANHIPQPWYRDPDSGPEDIWRWASHEEGKEAFVGSTVQILLRRWVYVMWDRWRIDEWSVLIKQWLPPIRRWELYTLPQLEEPNPDDGTPQMKERLLVRRRRLGLKPDQNW